MDQTVAEEYKSSLNDLNYNSKPLITMLTILAGENKKHAPTIVKTIVDHICSAPVESKLPGLYLVDSIMKNLRDDYMKIFCQQIITLFTSVFGKVDENTRSLMFKLRQTWVDVVPPKILYNLDVAVREIDPAWPVTAKNPSKKILVNPKFIERAVAEQRKISEMPVETPTSFKKEEDQLKQKQDEVLKQLLVKQEQLRQLEYQKMQMSIKKKAALGSNIPAASSFKRHPRDPRMVKINVQNISPSKNWVHRRMPRSNRTVIPEKPVEIEPINSSIPTIKPASSTSNVQPPVSISNVNILDQPAKSPDNQTIQPKKPAIKSNIKQAAISSHKVSEELRVNSDKNTASTIKNEVSPVKSPEKNLKKNSKGLKTSPKKKNITDNCKTPQIKAENLPSNVVRKKIFQMKIPKKTEKTQLALESNLLNSADSKSVNKDKKELNKSMKLDDVANKPKSDHNKVEDSQEILHDLNAIANKDEDLRILPLSQGSEAASVRMLKREIIETDSFSMEMEKLDPPRKKIKNDDIENQSPDQRSDTPVLFGNKDQDLRHLSDWSQYKANHPDEYSPGIQENFRGRFRHRKFHSPYRYQRSFDAERYAPYRSSTGWHSFRGNYHRNNDLNMARRRWPPVASVMFDSRAFLQQAEEKYRSGRISESEYIDLRRDLQKMAESSEHQLFKNHSTQKQELEQEVGICESKSLKQEPELQKNPETENIRIQRPSTNLPLEKKCVLDGKVRNLHYIDDKAIVLMDDNKPYEVTFKDEGIFYEIHIDGMAEPIIVRMDGKPVGFELNGQRYAVRIGVPGRELYINNNPYEVQFGGPPLLAMLNDEHIYKVHLSGPSPQVIVGSEPLHELFAKRHYVEHHVSKVQDSHTGYDISSSFGSLQDVDMRVKQDTVSQHDLLINEDSPFYQEGLKDVDWRQIPPTNSIKESEKIISSVFNDKNYETWINEDSSDRDKKVEKSVPTESVTYDWDVPMQQQHPEACMEQQRQHPPEQNFPPERYLPLGQNLSQEREHRPEQNLPQERLNQPEQNLSQERQHPSEQNFPQKRYPPGQNLPQERHHPPGQNLPQERYAPGQNLPQERFAPGQNVPQEGHNLPEHIQLQREHPLEHIQQQMQHFPPERNIQQQRQQPLEQIYSNRDNIHQQWQHPSEKNTHSHHHSSVHMQQQQHVSAHMQQQQHVSAHMQQQQPLQSDTFTESASQKWNYNRDNTYWRNDNYRKNYHSSYVEENNGYQASKASRSHYFEDEKKYYEPQPHSSHVPYIHRAPFRARRGRGRFLGPTCRPMYDFVRPRQYAPWQNAPLDQPRPRFPVAPQQSLLPPLFPSAPESFSARGVKNEKRPGLLPTPSPSFEIHPANITNMPIEPSTSEIQPAKLETSEMQVDIESLLEKLVAAGIINTKIYEEPEPKSAPEISATEKVENDEEMEEISEDIPQIELTTESLRMHRPSLITALHKGLQCATCGIRFKEEKNDQYSRHLDWHFRINRKEKDAKRTISRPWYYEIEDWLQFEEFEDFEERAPSYFELQAEQAPEVIVEAPVIPTVSAANDDQECCPVCLEKFQLCWIEDEEEWHFRNAVRHDDVAYHPACYEDFKKASEAEKALKSLENIDNNSTANAEITDILNTIIDDVCITIKIIQDIPNKSDLNQNGPSNPEDLEIPPPVEVHSEEEILEGKPGEEEIIGLISESDIEMDNEIPKPESKMVIMSSGGITLKVKAESLQCHSPSEKDTKVEDDKSVNDDDEIEFRPPTPDPNFTVQETVSKGRELSGLCCIM